MYSEKYKGQVQFIPDAVFRLVDARKLKGESIVSDKLATPPEPEQHAEAWERTTRPAYLLPETSSRSATELHDECAYLFRFVFQNRNRSFYTFVI